MKARPVMLQTPDQNSFANRTYDLDEESYYDSYEDLGSFNFTVYPQEVKVVDTEVF